ncbi:GNAT family N-acetyltransferase [Streptococcus merionis]|uniref:Ribosomal-protein-alanine acetyltransferase n=1 Tax=Streptococcus merionis TaxID=400065 RepID=A0A239STP7_9STRE|nr:GNAT family N-acetyltransferase [Streptococcus merionis]SNU88777.1 ribosomal-protein-alanine acetyltransferase [Streptococcus merionis]
MHFNSFDYTDFSEAIKHLYASVGWTSYLKDESLLPSAFDQSLDLLGAFDKDQLIGFIRIVGDGQHIVLIQDLLVHPDYQKRGIGTELLKIMWNRYAHVRMFQLNTDLHDVKANAFYQSLGMVPIAEGQIISYYRK